MLDTTFYLALLLRQNEKALVVLTHVIAYSLSISLLQQGAPELVPFGRVNEQQLPISCGQPVINDNIHPLTIMPKLWMERFKQVISLEVVNKSVRVA